MKIFNSLNILFISIYFISFLIILSILSLFYIKYKEKRKTKTINILVKKIANIAYEYVNKEPKEDEIIIIDETNIQSFKKKRKKYLQ
jgi:low temperature requirement protein LtrA